MKSISSTVLTSVVVSLVAISAVTAPLQAQPLTMPGVAFDQGELYSLQRDELIFEGQTFRWFEVPQDISCQTALRTNLNLDTPVTIQVTQTGTLYAVLWQWDFGFFKHAPADAMATLHGWQRLGPTGGSPLHRSGIASINSFLDKRLGPDPQPAPEPFAPMQLYSRPFTPGTYSLPLTEYFGQWVIVGFQSDTQIQNTASIVPPVTLEPVQTQHNVCNPGQVITITSEQPIKSVTLYRQGQPVLQSNSASFIAPQIPSRYSLHVQFVDASRWVPLTVAYPPIAKPSWPADFFPIHFYGGWGYVGLFIPNPDRLGELTTLNEFELQANTFFTGPQGNPLVNALNARTIRSVRGKTKYATREMKEDASAAKTFLYEISRHGPYLPNDFGFYVEDEPPTSVAQRMRACQESFNETEMSTQRHLIYCLHGAHAPDFWNTAAPTIRQTRAYPIRRAFKENYIPQIQTELADYLVTCQTSDNTTPFWLVAQSFGDLGRPNGTNRWDQPTPAQMRLMVNLALARGMRGLTYFCFDASPAGKEDLSAIVRHPYVPYDSLYDAVARINAFITEHAAFLNTLTWKQSIEQPNAQVDVQLLTDTNKQSFAYITSLDYNHPIETPLTLPQLDEPYVIRLQPGAAVIVNLTNKKELPCP